MSSKSNPIFSKTPVKNVLSSPSSSRPNSAKSVVNIPTTPIKTNFDSSPRKCRIQTEIQSSPCRGGNIIRSKVQLSCRMSPKVVQERMGKTKPSPRKEPRINDEKVDSKKQLSFEARLNCAKGAVKTHNSRRDIATIAKSETQQESAADAPSVNVKSMRSCFEHKEIKVPSRPPPSPSPSRAKSRIADSHPATPRNMSHGIKGILSSKSKYENTPTFRVPSAGNTPTLRSTKLRRSVSAGNLNKSCESPRAGTLARSSSQTITPKHRVKFQDEATPECFSPVLLESKGEDGNGDSISGEVTNLTVGVRIRPLFPGERSVVSVEESSVRVKALGTEHCFSYDYCFNSTGTQQDVFDAMVVPLVDAAFQGYNVCLFAYGQTGSGKSFSMMGEEITSSHDVPEKAGIIPRFSKQLFKIIEGSEEYSQTKVEISYFEIYNEKIHDLLGPTPQNGRGIPLRVREHPELGPYVVDLTVHNVHSFEKLQDWLEVGNSHRAIAATEMNMNSSRSHSIFTVTLTQSQSDDRPSLCSKINLIDLAGSERLAHTSATGDRLKEGVSINRSLLTLGKVISSLAENKKRGFIPYRESVLTWLLRESLGGNSRTAMLATISPSSQFVEETLSTLRYACQARNIINTVRVNESPHEKRIRELLEEIQRLKEGTLMRDHVECVAKLETVQGKVDTLTDDLSRANIRCIECEMETDSVRKELAEVKEQRHLEDSQKEREINSLLKELEEAKNQKTKCDREIRDLKKCLAEAKDRNLQYEEQVDEMRLKTDALQKVNQNYKEKMLRLERQMEEIKRLNKELKTEINTLDKNLTESKLKNTNYETDIEEMKKNILAIKNNISHDHCDNQILMLQTALGEAERVRLQYKEKNKMLEKKISDTNKITNHEGCEKEISVLKDTISELKESNRHENCEKVIEKLKLSLSETDKLVYGMRLETVRLKDENSVLKQNYLLNQKSVLELNNALSEFEKTNHHSECEERIDTLKKALAVAKSINVHVHCENRIAELEMEISNMKSETVADHSKCDEKINNLFFSAEKYADENKKLVSNHKAEISQYTEKIKTLEDQILKLKENKSKKDAIYSDNQTRILREENSQIKKKKVDDEKKLSSLEKQVISLTKDLLDVKNQLRTALRQKESSDSLCTQLQEQIAQQDRKLALTSSRQLFEDKENWETPSKVIRRSIAQHSKHNRDNDRCSLVMKAEEMHQALKDAEDICSRLKIPWVFQLEPEVTTHSWFDVNVRVWDQRNLSNVRWPSSVFLGWLRDMKEEIMSKSRGHKLFHSAQWLQSNKDPEPLPTESGDARKVCPLKEEVESLRNQIIALENLCEPKDKREVLSALTTLGKAVTQLSNKLGLSSPLRTSNMNVRS